MTDALVRRVRDMAELEAAYDVAAAATAQPDDHTGWRFDDLRNGFAACGDVNWVAEAGGAVVGAALAFRDDAGVRVRLLGIAPGLRGQGLGLRLLDALTEAAWSAGDRRIYLGAEDAAVDFYRRAGFSLVERAYGVTVFEKVPASARRLGVTADAPWLPTGSDAEVYRWRSDPPEPVCLVRVLARREGEMYVVDAPKGLDLPTRFVAHRPAPGEWRAALAGLCAELGVAASGECVGFVRNVVPVADASYPFPTPHAHFAVFAAHGEPGAGRWVGRAEATRGCAQRHWWSVAAAAMGWADGNGVAIR